MNVLDDQVLKPYCLTCQRIVDSKHTCQANHQVLLDEVLAGIASRLYNLGLQPLMATFYFPENQPNTYQLRITLTLTVDLNCEILGPLPSGWVYRWEGNTASVLEFSDELCVSKDEAEARLKEVVKDFEAFLDSRDAESIMAMMLLTS